MLRRRRLRRGGGCAVSPTPTVLLSLLLLRLLCCARWRGVATELLALLRRRLLWGRGLRIMDNDGGEGEGRDAGRGNGQILHTIYAFYA